MRERSERNPKGEGKLYSDNMEENNSSFDKLVRLLGEEVEKSDGSSSILQSLLQHHPEAQESLEMVITKGIEHAISMKQWGKYLTPYVSIEQVKKDFQEKNDYIVHSSRLDALDLVEITQGEFIEYLFERDVRFEREVQPFEDKESKEYLHWLMQKEMGVKVLASKG